MSKDTGYLCGKCGREPNQEELNSGTCRACFTMETKRPPLIESSKPNSIESSWPAPTAEEEFSERHAELIKRKAKLEEELIKINEEIEAMTVLSWCS
jgi:hypothetical protein